MCGIAGELRLESGAPVSVERVRAMCDVMVHRGPDDFGVFTTPDVALGMRRLSIVDVAGGHQPLCNEDGSVQVVCNGEIYNAPRLMKELVARGHTLRTRSDVEVIAHLYEEEGVRAIARLDGMFAFALWDGRARRLVLGRDRAGIKPLYLTEVGGRLTWGSELKCLLAGGLAPEIEPQVLHDYLTLGYVPGPASMVRGAYQLPPAHVLVAEAGRPGTSIHVESYWAPAPAAERERRTTAEWTTGLLDVLRESVASHLMSDVPLGVFLSGGLDSGTIVALMHELGVAPIRTFTIGFSEQSFDETAVARQVATRYGTVHEELVVEPDAAALLPTLVRHFDEPFADSSAIPVYYLSRLARQHVAVVLSGEGGDEVLAGYETYRAGRLAALYRRLPEAIGRRLIPSLVARLPVSHARVSFDYKAKRFVTGAYLSPPAAHLWWKTILSEEAKAGLYAGGGAHGLAPTSRLFEQAWDRASGDRLDRLQAVDQDIYLASDILVKADRMSMAHSLEARVPFLDRAVVEFARKVPSGLRMRGLSTKYLLRRAMAKRLPGAVVRGKKRGFNVPLPSWLAGGLKEFARDLLSPARLRRHGLLDPAAVERLLQEHAAHVRDHSRAIWTLLVLTAWQDQMRESTRPVIARASA